MSQPKKKESPTSTPSSPAPKLVPDRDPGPVPTAPLKPDRRPVWILASLIVGGLIVVGLGVAAFAFVSQASGVVRSTRIAGVDVGGLKSSAALEEVTAAWREYQAKPLAFRAGTETPTFDVTATSSKEDEIVTDLIGFSPTQAVNQAATFGHRGTFLQQVRERLSGWLGRRHDFGQMSIAVSTIEEMLADKLDPKTKMPVDAAIKVEAGVPVVTAHSFGSKYDTTSAARRAARLATRLDHTVIEVNNTVTNPVFQQNSTLQRVADEEMSSTLDRAPVTLKLDQRSWTINVEKMTTLLGFRRDANGSIRVGFDATKTKVYLETIRKEIDVEPREARFQVTGAKVEAFATSQVGRSLDTTTTIERLNALLAGTEKSANVAIIEKQPISKSIGANQLGITELVAEGKTNFRGSPANRRYNLSYGAQLLNGLLIKPGETFSLVSALGPVDAKHGWKPELVIKGSKITPEFGGGLCQVATTLFRAALNAGLPIVERKNHSLRISYYEPPIGLDATIYEPKPDLRFTNDYNRYLLLQTEVVGTELIFRFFGTQDGRKVTIPTPRVYNKTGIPKTTYVETTDLKPGQQVCQAPGHPGADATATYTVTKADGTAKTQVFQSHYRAIGVICRVGKKATPKPTTNTNTSPNTNSAE